MIIISVTFTAIIIEIGL